MCKKAKKYGSLNKKGGVGPPDGVVVGWGMVGYGFEVSSVGYLSTGRQHQPRRTRGTGSRARPDLPHPLRGLAIGGHWLRDLAHLVSVLPETANQDGGRVAL